MKFNQNIDKIIWIGLIVFYIIFIIVNGGKSYE